ncbi:MAG: hypothetical protein ACR5KV_05390 [Wolbachia sp.]
MVRVINEAKVEKEDILLFDRGVAKTGTFVEFDKREYKFITRIHLKRKYDIVGKMRLLRNNNQMNQKFWKT